MIVAIASLPNPPLLLPGITGRPVAEVEQLRAACLDAIGAVMAAEPDVIVVAGGVEPAEMDKPLSMTVGRSLLSEFGCTLPVEHLAVPADTPTHECAAIGRGIADRSERVGLLVMADGSARRTVKAPGYLDDRAAPFDARITSALAEGDRASLTALEPDLAAELMVAGRAAWQVLAGAAGDVRWNANLFYADDPFGVCYPVAVWR
jgi:hypothetical protein